jgi:hypothetical protein
MPQEDAEVRFLSDTLPKRRNWVTLNPIKV